MALALNGSDHRPAATIQRPSLKELGRMKPLKH